MIIDIIQYIIISDRLPEFGTRLTIDDRWEESGLLYCHLLDEPAYGGGTDCTMAAIVAFNDQQYLLLGSTPDQWDGPYRTFTAARLIGTDTIELVPKEELDSIMPACEEALKTDIEQQIESLRQYFGTFRVHSEESKYYVTRD